MGLQKDLHLKNVRIYHFTVSILWYDQKTEVTYVRFEVFTAVTMKNGIFWNVKPCGSCKNRPFGRT
jgi:hypothetical protein